MTVLDVEWKILDRNITGGLEHPVAQPDHLPRVGHDHVGVDGGRVVLCISTARRSISLQSRRGRLGQWCQTPV